MSAVFLDKGFNDFQIAIIIDNLFRSHIIPRAVVITAADGARC